jgi:ribosome-associated toxin RatA of RatAB toxin-antitoxin module
MRTLCCAASAWLMTLAILPAKPFLEFTPEEQTRLIAGEPLLWEDRTENRRFTTAAILLNHPVEQVWALIDEKEAMPSFIANLRQAQLLSREANICLIAQQTEAAGRTFNYVMEHVLTPPQRVDFRRLRGDFRHIEGYWFFDPVEEGRKTLLVYRLHLDPGALVPQNFVIGSQMKAFPLIMTSIRDKLASQVWPPAPGTSQTVGPASTPAPSPAGSPGPSAGQKLP